MQPESWRPRRAFVLGILVGSWITFILAGAYFRSRPLSDLTDPRTAAAAADDQSLKRPRGLSPEDDFLFRSEMMVGISSYRDPLCQDTVWSALAMAVNVDRIWLSVYQQVSGEEPDCVAFRHTVCTPINRTALEAVPEGERHEKPFYRASPMEVAQVCGALDRVIVQTVPFMEGKGPTVSRYHSQRMVRNSTDFFMQVDSHSWFIAGWDIEVLRQWKATGNPKAVLSTYPRPHDRMPLWIQTLTPLYMKEHPPVSPGDYVDASSSFFWKYQVVWHENTEFSWLPTFHPEFVSVICHAIYTGNVPQNDAAGYFSNHVGRPFRTPFWGAGLAFSSAQAVRDVLYDVHTPYLFQGEEMSMAVRLFTHGYDVYAPSVDIVFHAYGSSGLKRAKYWDVDWEERRKVQERSQERVRYLLRMPHGDFDKTEMDKFDLGTKRSMEEFSRLAAVNFTAQYSLRLCEEIAEYRFPDYPRRPAQPPPTEATKATRKKSRTAHLRS